MILRHLGMVTLLSTALVLGSCAGARKQAQAPQAQQFEEPTEEEVLDCYTKADAACLETFKRGERPESIELTCGKDGRIPVTVTCYWDKLEEEFGAKE